MKEITPEIKAKVEVLDNTARTLEYISDSFIRAKEVDSDIKNIHMEHRIAKDYMAVLMEVYPKAETLYEDDIINAIGEIGLHYTYLTGKIMYVNKIFGHRMYAIL